MPGINVLAKKAGLIPVTHDECGTVRCKVCNKTVNASNAVDELFKLILQAVKEGEVVYIKGFGTFKGRIFKGRTLESPVLAKGKVTFGDQLILRFHSSALAKKFLNAKGEKAAAAKSKKASKPEVNEEAEASEEAEAPAKKAPKAEKGKEAKKAKKGAA